MGPYTLHNPILQFCSILSIIVSMIVLVATFVPNLGFEEEFSPADRALVRLALVIIILGSIQGIV